MAKVTIMPISGNKENFKIKIQGKFGNKFIVKPKVYEVIQENNDTTVKLVNTFDKTVLVSGYQVTDFEVDGNTFANIEDLTQAISIAVFKKGGGGAAEDLTQADVNNVKAWDYNSLNNLPNLNLKADLDPLTGKLVYNQLPNGIVGLEIINGSTVADLPVTGQPNVIYLLDNAPEGQENQYIWRPSLNKYEAWSSEPDNLYISELHVDPINGLDSNIGSINYPFKTLTNALVQVKAGQKIVLHTTVDALGYQVPYTGDYTLSTPDVTICSLTAESGAQTVLTGTLTVTSNTGENRINDVAINNVVHAGSAYLYIDDVLVNNDIVKNGTGELAINQCQVNNKIDINSSGTTSINGGWHNIINQYDDNAYLYIYNIDKDGIPKKIFIQNGFLTINNSYIGTGLLNPSVPNSEYSLLCAVLCKRVVLKDVTIVDTNGVDGSGLISIKTNVPYYLSDVDFDEVNSELLGVSQIKTNKFTGLKSKKYNVDGKSNAPFIGIDSNGDISETAVKTVAGQAINGTGDILSNVDNTSDINKPISTAVQSALNLKQNTTDNTLNTTNKTIVGGINELNTSVTSLSNLKQNVTDNALNTTNKTVVGAINEVNTNKQNKTDNTLNTTDKTVVGAINELNNSKQNNLVAGVNIKTIAGNSLLGSGNLSLTKTDVGLNNVDNTSDLNKPISTLTQASLNNKQDNLLSGINIKTINNTSLLGSGNLNLIGSKNEAGQVKVDYTGLSLINFATNVEKQFDIGSAVPTIATSPTTTYPFSTPNNYSGIFNSSRNGGTSAFAGRLIENPKFGQPHAWRIIGTYSNKPSGNTGELVISLRNPVSGFNTSSNIAFPNGKTTGSFSVLLYTIADSASITPPNGYILTAQISFADTNLNITINSITRFSNAIDN